MKAANFGASCEALLNAFATHLTGQGIDVPERLYVGPGIMAWDGESMSLYLGTINQGEPGAPIGTAFIPGLATHMSATIYIQLLRVVSALTYEGMAPEMIPGTANLNADGVLTMGDALGLMKAAIDIHSENVATDPGQGFTIGPITPLGPAGGLAGTRLALTVSLD